MSRMLPDLSKAWEILKDCGAKLDEIEKRVREFSRRPTPPGRETPFWATKKFPFARGDLTPQSSPLVHSAGRVTRVVRLSYSVQLQPIALTGQPVATAVAQARPAWFVMMRPNPRGMFRDVAPQTGTPSVAAFDFEWRYQIGSSEANYVQSRTLNESSVWLSRNSLGNPENDKQLLVSERNPIVLKTNEFLTIEVRPTFSWIGVDPTGDSANFDDFRFVVNFTYVGARTFGYD